MFRITAGKLVRISIIVFIISLAVPAFTYITKMDSIPQDCYGAYPLIIGWFPLIFELIALPQGKSFIGLGLFAWLSNPLIFIAWIGIFINNKKISRISAIAALILSLSFLSISELETGEPGIIWKNVTVNFGYFLWIFSMVVALVASFNLEAPGKKVDVISDNSKKKNPLLLWIRKRPYLELILWTIGLIWFGVHISNPDTVWKEEVKLNDGRVVVVEQKRRMDGPVALEDWVTINLPEISPQPIVWHENLAPLILNINEGRLFVVARAGNYFEQQQYGNVTPAYYGFEWNGMKFVRISFEKIPEKIYTTNLLLDDSPKHGESFIDINIKEKVRHGIPPTPSDLLRLDPNLGCFC